MPLQVFGAPRVAAAAARVVGPAARGHGTPSVGAGDAASGAALPQQQQRPRQRPYVFVSVFKWEARKGWDVLLRAFLQEFGAAAAAPAAHSSSSSSRGGAVGGAGPDAGSSGSSTVMDGGEQVRNGGRQSAVMWLACSHMSHRPTGCVVHHVSRTHPAAVIGCCLNGHTRSTTQLCTPAPLALDPKCCRDTSFRCHHPSCPCSSPTSSSLDPIPSRHTISVP